MWNYAWRTNKMAAQNSSHAQKNPPDAAHALALAPEFQGLAYQNIFTQTRKSLPNPQGIQVWTLPTNRATEPITPTEECYKPVGNPHSDTEEVTAKEKMLTMELLLNKVSPENTGGFVFLFFIVTLPLQQCLNRENCESGSLASRSARWPSILLDH